MSAEVTMDWPRIEVGANSSGEFAHAAAKAAIQPYEYRRRELVEPDWRRLPGWREVDAASWRDTRWQRVNSVRSLAQLRLVLGHLVADTFYEDAQRDQEQVATMPLLITPQMLNTIVPDREPSTESFYADPVRRYMLPVLSDRDPIWPSHPLAIRDSLHESAMWAVEGLIHRYPTKALLEVVVTCSQYCGHCTRMDLVGGSTPQVPKRRFQLDQGARFEAMLDYLRSNHAVRDVVVSGGDLAAMPWPRLETLVARLLELENIRDIRLASKGLVGLPQYWLAAPVRRGLERLARQALDRGVGLAVHTHANVAQQITPLVAEAARGMLAAGVRDVRNQGVLLRGVNTSAPALLDLCFALLDGAGMTPYYFYLCDMIPASEHWRISVAQAQEMQEQIMGYLPGFATPRLVCDVPYVGKRWVHQAAHYDRNLGISLWSKAYLTPLEMEQPAAIHQRYPYYDPIWTLDEHGQQWWRTQAADVL